MTNEENIKKVRDFGDKAIPLLEQYGLIEKQEVRKEGNLKWIGIILICMSFVAIFLYAIHQEAFKSDISNSCPEINCPSYNLSCPSLTCPSCPNQVCDTTCSFPDNLSINLKNQS